MSGLGPRPRHGEPGVATDFKGPSALLGGGELTGWALHRGPSQKQVPARGWSCPSTTSSPSAKLSRIRGDIAQGSRVLASEGKDRGEGVGIAFLFWGGEGARISFSPLWNTTLGLKKK